MKLLVADTLERLFAASPYGLDRAAKTALIEPELRALGAWHSERCAEYARLVRGLGGDAEAPNLTGLPFVPVRLFKEMKLQSVADADVFKVLTSSGTSGQAPARIVLDAATAQLQTRALMAIMTSFTGKQRLPMVICDSQSVLRDRDSHSARAAGILGMSSLGRQHFYALDSDMRLDADGLLAYLAARPGAAVLFFGFTFMIWRHVVEALRAAGRTLPANDGILIHGGGWKKLADEAVDNQQFKSACRATLGVSRVHNFYGMVEQVGSIYVECEEGFLHAPNFAEILIRDYRDWSVLPPGREGVIQTLSVLPQSYPGHSLLTEDLGVVHGCDDCRCGRRGTYFTVCGRIPSAELRGCSDTYAETRGGA